jgi:UDP-N-acetylmuramoyl-L-alanyl-D-glutamate--2,6-diaminopimelate ligase
MSRTITVNALIDALRRAKLLIRVNGGAYSEDITGITYNSNDIEAGYLFVCKGAHFREEYLKAALAAGASCYVSEELYGYGTLICPEIIVSDIRAAMSVIAQTYYGILSDSLRVIGITGTKGKSTTTYFVRSILDESMAAVGGHRTAICSGIENYDGVIEEESHLTTPEIMELYQHMDNALRSAIEYMTMEMGMNIFIPIKQYQ